MPCERRHYSYFAIGLAVAVTVLMLHNNANDYHTMALSSNRTLHKKLREIDEFSKREKQAEEEKLATAKKLEECNKNVEKSNLKVQSEKQHFLDLQNEYDDIRKQLDNKNQEISKVNTDLNNKVEEITFLSEKMNTMQKELALAKEVLKKKEDAKGKAVQEAIPGPKDNAKKGNKETKPIDDKKGPKDQLVDKPDDIKEPIDKLDDNSTDSKDVPETDVPEESEDKLKSSDEVPDDAASKPKDKRHAPKQ